VEYQTGMSCDDKAVMVVDDNRDVLTVITTMLKKQGYQAHEFIQPVKALAHAKECKECGIVVSDVRMPVMNGFQLVRALRESRLDMKVVIMSAFEINKNEWQLITPSTVVDQFVTKPFNEQQLVTAIEKCIPLEKQSLSQSL
jgi:FixJ family two-component response regulator